MTTATPLPRATTRPRAHVVLATYRPSMAYLAAQVDSILAQQDVEITVTMVDDGSPSERLAEIEALAADPRVRVVSGRRLGVFHNFERGLRLAPRDVDAILLSDQDDLWRPQKAATLVRALEASSEILLAHSDARVIDGAGEMVARSMFAAEGRDIEHLDVDHLIVKNVVTGCTAAIRPELLSIALPFPQLGEGAPFHHDLWLALCAASTGRVATVTEVLGDYRQHGANVVGLEPARNRWLDPRRAIADWRLRRLVALTVDHAVRHGQLPAGGPAGEARHWLGRRGGFHLLRLAAQWRREGDPQASFALLLGFVGLLGIFRVPRIKARDRARRVRRLAPLAARAALRLARDPALRAKLIQRLDEQVTSANFLGDAAEPLPLVVRPIPSTLIHSTGPRTVQVLVPYIPDHGIFGGVATAMRLAVELAHQGEEVRVVETDRTDDLDPWKMRAALRRSLGVPEDWVEHISFASATRTDRPLEVGKHDVFVATAWWTAQRAHWTADDLGLTSDRFVYLIQDFEPSFYAGSDAQALAEWTYRMPCWPVVNSRTLADYLRQETALSIDDDLILAPQVDVETLSKLPRPARSGGPVRVLLYGRPSVPRNLFETAVRGLAHWLSSREPTRPVEVVSAGEMHRAVSLPDGVVVRSLGQLSWERYLGELEQAHIGLSLMLSPHPSYPPLEMAAAGLVVVSNRYAGKDLEHLGPRLVSCEPTSLDVARALGDAEERLSHVGNTGRDLDLSQLGQPLEKVVSALRERLNR